MPSIRTYMRNHFIPTMQTGPARGKTSDGCQGDPDCREGTPCPDPCGETSPSPIENQKAPLPPQTVADPLQPAIYKHRHYPRWLRFIRRQVKRLWPASPKKTVPAQPVVAPPVELAPAPADSTAKPAPVRKPTALKFLRLLFPKRYPPTAEELFLIQSAAASRKVQQQLLTESKLFRARITNVLDRRGLCYRYRKHEKDFFMAGVQSVKFRLVKMYPDALYYWVDTDRLPRDIGIMQLMSEDVLTDLSIACGHRVSGIFNDRTGCVFVVERSSGVLGIPNHVMLDKLWEATPAYADGLSIPFGLTSNSRPVYKSLSQFYSLLIAGTIGSGKSNFANVLLCTLIRRNPPDRLKLMLVDLKGGLEFSFYEGVPHLLKVPGVAESGICDDRLKVPDMLDWLLAEGERRIKTIRDAGYKDIGRFNQTHRKNHMPHIVLAIDEWADIRLEPKTGAKSEDKLTNICQRFRAVGVHVILCTQVPKAEIISTRIKGVLPAKVAFSVPTNPASLVILDNGHAKSLDPVGRCILQWQDEQQIQTPFIPDAMIHDVVEGAKCGKFEKVVSKAHDVTELEILSWALENDSGWMSIQRLFAQFKNRGITRQEISDLCASWEDREFVIGSSLYRVAKAVGNQARRLVAMDQSDSSTTTTP